MDTGGVLIYGKRQSMCVLSILKFTCAFEQATEELQWLKHGWLVYHGCFELVLESLGKKAHSCRFGIIKGVFIIHIENGILCVLIRIALMRRF